MKYGMIINKDSLFAAQFELAGKLGVEVTDIQFVMRNGVSKVEVNGEPLHGYRPSVLLDGSFAIHRFMTPEERAADLEAAKSDPVRKTIIGEIVVVMYVDKIVIEKGHNSITIDDEPTLLSVAKECLSAVLEPRFYDYITDHKGSTYNVIGMPKGADLYELVSVLADTGRRVFCRPVSCGGEVMSDRVKRLQDEYVARLPKDDMTDLSVVHHGASFKTMLWLMNSKHDPKLQRAFLDCNPTLCTVTGEVYYPIRLSVLSDVVARAVKIGDDLFTVYE